MQKIIAFFLAIITFFANLFGLSKNSPPKETSTVKNGIVLIQNARYSDGERNLMDITFPEGASGNFDLILDIHGGGWVAFSKDNETDNIKNFAKMGYVGAAISYTYISESVHCDTILNEITLALAAIKQKAADNGIYINNVLLMGASAGAHLATLYAYSRGNESGLNPVAVMSLCGPNSLEYVSEIPEFYNKNALGDTEYVLSLMSWLTGYKLTTENLYSEEARNAIAKYSPANYVDTAVPTIICQGEKDEIVPYKNAVILDNLLSERNVRHDFITYPNSGHELGKDPDSSDRCFELFVLYASDYLVK